MPAYLFTLHSYRSWNADHPRGFVQAGCGIQPPNTALARYYDRQATHEPVLFGDQHQQTILWIVWDACQNRTWRLHAVAFEPSHVHILVSWSSAHTWQTVRRKLKNLIGWSLSKAFHQSGQRWLVRGGSRKRIRDRRHFDHLVSTYLPRHGGMFWKEGDRTPQLPAWAAKLAREPLSSDGG
jgi:REP element-mobilizing transposase RayT